MYLAMRLGDFLRPFLSNSTLTTLCVLVIATFAITLIFKTSATTNFAQSSIAALGCYFGTSYLINDGISIWYATLIGVVFGILCGIFIDVCIFRRGRHVNLAGKQIITMGLVTVIANIIPMIYKYTNSQKIPAFSIPGIESKIKITIDGVKITLTTHSLICVGLTIIILTILFLLLKFSKWGLGVRTTASNEYVAQMMGVNTHVITAVSWGIAGGLGALAAVMFVGGPGSFGTNPYFMTSFQVDAFLAGVLGGFGSFGGPIIAAILIKLFGTGLGVLSAFDGWEFMTQYDMVIVYALVLICILIKPNGLFGKKTVKKV